MSARLEKVEDGQAIVKMEVNAERFEEGLQVAYRKVMKDVMVPGFRKGKVPRQVLEAQFGREVLYEDALEYVLPGAFAEAVSELALEPIGRPEYEFEDIKPGEAVQVTISVPVHPEVVLGSYEGIQVEIPVFAVEEQQVDNLIEEMRGRYAEQYDKIDEPAAEGDSLLIDFIGYLDEVPFEGGQSHDYPLVLGSNTFIPGFEDQLIGAKLNEEVEVKVAFPEQYHSEELKGKDAVFKVNIKKIGSKKLRDLDDEFAQEVSEYETLEELRNNIRQDFMSSNEQKRTEAIKEQLLAKLIETSELNIAPSVISEEAERMMEQFDHRLSHQGFSLDRYLAMVGNTREQFKEEMKGEAEKSIKSHFILGKIAEEKGIEISDAELDENITLLATKAEKTLEEAKEMLGDSIENIKLNMMLDKATQCIIDTAVISEVAGDASVDA